MVVHMSEKINKPNFADYGITEEDYNLYIKSYEIINKKDETNVFNYILVFVIISDILLYVAAFFADVVIYICTFNAELFIYLLFHCLFGSYSIWELVGFSLGFSIIGYANYQSKMKKIDAEADKLLERFSQKQIDMIKLYDDDYNKFILNINGLKSENKEILKMINEYKSKISGLKLEDFFLDTKQLIRFYEKLNSVEYKNIDGYNDCFLYNDKIVKFVGEDNFITKIDIDNLMRLFKSVSATKIIIYITVSYDVSLVSKDIFVVVGKDKIYQAYKKYYQTQIKICNIRLDNNNKIIKGDISIDNCM